MRTKFFIFFLMFSCTAVTAFSQNNRTFRTDLPRVFINNEVSLYFVSTDPIKHIDASTTVIDADSPLENVVRVKVNLADKEVGSNEPIGVLTIGTKNHIVQYDLFYTTDKMGCETQIDITSEISNYSFSKELTTTDKL